MQTKTSDPQLKRMSTNPQEPPGSPEGGSFCFLLETSKIVSAAFRTRRREPIALLKPEGFATDLAT